MVISAFTGATSTTTIKYAPKPEDSTYQIVRKASNDDIGNMISTEQYVRQYFADVPIMIQIARCESHFRQLDSDGEIHRGVVNNADVGVMQINEFYHLDTAEKENYNIYTLEGNTAYARDLYERQGTAPWSSSKPCWGKYASVSTSVKTTADLAVNTK